MKNIHNEYRLKTHLFDPHHNSQNIIKDIMVSKVKGHTTFLYLQRQMVGIKQLELGPSFYNRNYFVIMGCFISCENDVTLQEWREYNEIITKMSSVQKQGGKPNRFLERNINELTRGKSSLRIFVPLCGKYLEGGL